MYISAIIGSLCDIVFLNMVYSKQYKQLMIKVPPNNNFKIKNKEYLLCNQIAVQATDSMPTILITSIYNLKLASVYGLYNLVQNMIKMVIKTIQFSISEVFGNVTVSESESRINSIYDLLGLCFPCWNHTLYLRYVPFHAIHIYIYELEHIRYKLSLSHAGLAYGDLQYCLLHVYALLYSFERLWIVQRNVFTSYNQCSNRFRNSRWIRNLLLASCIARTNLLLSVVNHIQDMDNKKTH